MSSRLMAKRAGKRTFSRPLQLLPARIKTSQLKDLPAGCPRSAIMATRCRPFAFSRRLSMGEVTRILSAIDKGDPRASGELLPLVYEELRRLAATKLAHEKPGQTLQATA